MFRTQCPAVLLALVAVTLAHAGDEKKVVGTYRLVERVSLDGKTRKKPPEVLGSTTFSKTQRSIIMKWETPEGEPVSIAMITRYTLSGGKFCEAEEYGVQTNLGGPGVAYDKPVSEPVCTAAVHDAAGFAFDVPGEKVRIQITRDGMVSTTPRWVDHWEKVK